MMSRSRPSVKVELSSVATPASSLVRWSGTYGSVSKATNKSTKLVRAIKTIPKSHLKNVARFRQEVRCVVMLPLV